MQTKLNPKITEFEYGKRELKSLTVYPLSLSDQFKITDLFARVIQSLPNMSAGTINEIEIFTAFLQEVEKEAHTLIQIVCDVDMEQAGLILDQMTNDQFTEFVDKLWEANYSDALKNAKSLFEKVKNHFTPTQPETSKRSLQQSLNDTPSTLSTNSLDSATIKEVLPPDKSESSTSVAKKDETLT